MTLRSVFFDLDQTVAVTAPILYGAWNAAMNAIGQPDWTPTQIVDLFGPPEHVALRTVADGQYAQAFDAYLTHYHAHHDQVAMCEGMDALLSDLKRRGVPTGLMTGKGRATTEITLHRLGIRDLFDLVVTGDEVVNPKPHHEGVEVLLRATGTVPGEAVMVGDMVNDVRAAHGAGVRCAGALWVCEWREELMASGPDVAFETVAELGAWLDAELTGR